MLIVVRDICVHEIRRWSAHQGIQCPANWQTGSPEIIFTSCTKLQNGHVWLRTIGAKVGDVALEQDEQRVKEAEAARRTVFIRKDLRD